MTRKLTLVETPGLPSGATSPTAWPRPGVPASPHKAVVDAMLPLFEGMTIPLWYKNLGGQYVYVNEAYAALLGLPIDDITGKHDLELPVTFDFSANCRSDLAACDRADALVTEESIQLPDADRLRVRTTRRRVMRDGEVIGIAATLQPVTPTSLSLESCERRLRQHFAHVAHELRTPLGGVLGLARIVLDEGQLSPKQERHLRAIEHCGQHLLGLANDIVDIAELEAGPVKVSPVKTDLAELFSQVRECLMPSATAKRVHLDFPAQADLPGPAHVDPLRLRQILLNLLGNAIRHTHDAGVSLRTRRLTGSQADPACTLQRWQFEVGDAGCGMPAETVHDLNTEWNHAVLDMCAGNRRGLGLKITNRLVRAMDGHMYVSSQLGRGTVVTFQITA